MSKLAIELNPALRNHCLLKGRLPDDLDRVRVGDLSEGWINATADTLCERARADSLVRVIDGQAAALKAAVEDLACRLKGRPR